MSAARRKGGAGRGLAAALALLSVLMLLAVPALAGRAHAAMPSMPGMASGMAMSDAMEMTTAPASVAAPLHHTATEAICMAACSLAGQLLPAQVQGAAAVRRADALVRYFAESPPLAGMSEEPRSPPPR